MTIGCGLPTGRRQVLSLLVLAIATAALIGSASPARALGTSTTLTKDVVHYLSAATLVGAVSPTQQMTVGVVLSNPNQQAEDSYLAQLYDPSSSLY